MSARAILLGFTVPLGMLEDVLKRDIYLPIQTHRFAWSLARVIKSSVGGVRLISSIPASTYPNMPQVFFFGKNFEAEGLQGSALGFINLIFLKHITRLWGCIRSGLARIRQYDPSLIFVHGIHSPYLIFALLIQRKSLKVIFVLTDPPAVILDSDGMLSRAFKKIDGKVIRWALGRADGIVALSRRLGSDFAPQVPCLTLAGFLDEHLERNNYAARRQRAFSNSPKFVIAYAGTLDERYGVLILIEAVKKLKETNPLIELWLYGKGDILSKIDQYSEVISYKGIRNPRELYLELTEVDVLVNPRPSHQEFTKYSFPSKLIEGLALGIPMLSTVLSGVPEEFYKYIHKIEKETSEGVVEAIRRFFDINEDRRFGMAAEGREFVIREYSESGCSRRLADFLISNKLISE